MFMEGHSHMMGLSENETRMVQDLTKLNVKPRDILSTLKDQNPNNVSSLRTIYNARRKFRISEQEGRTPMQNVMHILQTKGYDFEYRLNEDTNELKELFFMHPTSLNMWQAFPHVVLMDCTYNTNKYKLPFLEIVGVTSTNKTFSIAFAYMRNEKACNHRWALTCLKLTINASFCPRVIVTDRELALMKACDEVFPQSNHLLCRWHIFNDITKHCRPRIKSHRTWSSLHQKWKELVESPTETAYMQNYANLQTLLVDYPAVFCYLYNTWLNKYAEKFVSVWTDKHINFGNSTTNRAESQHSKLKTHLESGKSDLDRFIYVIEKVVQSQDTAIKESLERCKSIRKPKFNKPLFQQLQGFVSEHAMDKILEEFNRSKGLMLTPESCGCQLWTSFGLPCAHELVMYVSAGLPIPLDSVDAFWRKLDLSPSICVEYGDLDCDNDMQRFKEVFNNQPDHGKFSFLRKLRGIIDPSKILIGEPSVKKNNRGCPKTKHVHYQTQVPHRHSCLDLNQEPPRHSFFMNKEPPRHNSFFMNEEPPSLFDLNFEPTGQCPYTFDLNTEPTCQFSKPFDLNSEPIGQCLNPIDLNEEPLVGYGSLWKEISEIFHPYITCIIDVMGDGNCEFRSIAACLGIGEDRWLYVRQQLLDELLSSYDAYARVYTYATDELVTSLSFSKSPAPSQHWMIMPMTSILIANTFGVIIHFLSNTMSVTCFPLWKGPEEFQHHQVLTIAHVHDNHYVMVQLGEEYPMPPIMGLWIRHKAPSAAAWETKYRSRLESYTKLKSFPKDYVNVDYY